MSLETLERMQRVLQTSTSLSTAHGKPVHCLHSVFLPGDGLVIWLFSALDAIDIRDIYEANELPFTRIVEVTDLTLTTESSQSV
ncbi:MAG: hypothetical protein KF753_23640 [Caldilineaceae bacterium]|nr:hypothetical protein [Caldilineaceae bacterium]